MKPTNNKRSKTKNQIKVEQAYPLAYVKEFLVSIPLSINAQEFKPRFQMGLKSRLCYDFYKIQRHQRV